VHSDTLKLQSHLRQLLTTASSYTYSVNDGSVPSEAISAAKAVFDTLKAAVPRLSQQRPNTRRRFGKCIADASCLRRRLHAYRLKRALKKKRQKAYSSDILIFPVTIKFHIMYYFILYFRYYRKFLVPVSVVNVLSAMFDSEIEPIIKLYVHFQETSVH